MQIAIDKITAVKVLTPVASLCLGLGLGACGGADSPQASADRGGTSVEPGQRAAKLSKPEVEVPSGPPPKQLVAEDLESGSGPAAKAGDEVTVHYVGVEYRGGKQIDASWDRGEPLSFQLGGGTVIRGWEEGVPGMKVGGRRQLTIPSNLAYGSGALVFVIDLVGIGSAADPRPREGGSDLPRPKVEVPEGPPPKELVVEDLKAGSGAAVEAGDEIVVDYVGVTYRTGEEFESTWEKGKPGTFELTRREVIEGWQKGLPGMKVGGRRELIIPSKLAYGTGALIYVVDLVDVG